MSARIIIFASPELIEPLRATPPTGWTIEDVGALTPAGWNPVRVLADDAPAGLDGRVVSPVIARNYNTGEVYVLSYGDPLSPASIAELTGGIA